MSGCADRLYSSLNKVWQFIGTVNLVYVGLVYFAFLKVFLKGLLQRKRTSLHLPFIGGPIQEVLIYLISLTTDLAPCQDWTRHLKGLRLEIKVL